jgi:two-component system, cell cycle sensor histidine kinase and response regulator CckA
MPTHGRTHQAPPCPLRALRISPKIEHRSHKGAICVYSEVGHGSTFCIYLPPAEEARKEHDASGRSELITGTARILIVDDEEVVRELARVILVELGYSVTVCKDGKEAVDYYRMSWREIDLVLLDMVMPELGGRDTFAAMRRINPAVRVILSSGYSINSEAQGNGFCRKAF